MFRLIEQRFTFELSYLVKGLIYWVDFNNKLRSTIKPKFFSDQDQAGKLRFQIGIS
jgi:hypothetical protein